MKKNECLIMFSLYCCCAYIRAFLMIIFVARVDLTICVSTPCFLCLAHLHKLKSVIWQTRMDMIFHFPNIFVFSLIHIVSFWCSKFPSAIYEMIMYETRTVYIPQLSQCSLTGARTHIIHSILFSKQITILSKGFVFNLYAIFEIIDNCNKEEASRAKDLALFTATDWYSVLQLFQNLANKENTDAFSCARNRLSEWMHQIHGATGNVWGFVIVEDGDHTTENEYSKSDQKQQTSSGSGSDAAAKSKNRDADRFTVDQIWAMFSHVIYPKKGEVWALFRGWDINWRRFRRLHSPHKYLLVEKDQNIIDLGLVLHPKIQVTKLYEKRYYNLIIYIPFTFTGDSIYLWLTISSELIKNIIHQIWHHKDAILFQKGKSLDTLRVQMMRGFGVREPP
ncbi:hypothetical protein ACJX0J_030609 [Zea mays]